MLGANYEGDGDNIRSLNGQTGTIAAGKNYIYFSSDRQINASLDELSANGGTLLFECDRGIGRTVAYEGPAKQYKVIYSTFIFGGIRGISEKNGLMKTYMDWLCAPASINQEPFSIIDDRIFSTNARGKNMIHIGLLRAAKLEVSLYTMSGRLVNQMAQDWFEEGSHFLTLDKLLISKGNYLLSVTADGQAVTKLIFITE